MHNDEQKKPKPDLAIMNALSAGVRILRTEDRELYDRIHTDFVACLAPEDILAGMLVHRLVNEAWFIMRYHRHQSLAIERRFHQSLDFQVQRIKTQNLRKDALARNLAERTSQNPTEVAQLVYLEKVGNAIEAVDDILERTPTELEHNRALEKSIDFQVQLDGLVTNATKRFNETIELLDRYKTGLGNRLRQAAEALLNPKGTEHEENPPLAQTVAPPIAPSEEANLGDGADNQIPSSNEETK